jgi:hypothetical protein
MMMMMQRAQWSSDGKIIKLEVTEESLETELMYWIRDFVKSHGELVPALERLRRSYRELRDGKPVTCCEEALWQVEEAFTVAQTSSLLGLAWFRDQEET